jgi:homopolymeric O-antigen transport system permease protein
MSTYGEWLRDFWKYRELFYFLAWRNIKVRYKQTVLGIAWALIQPVFSMIVFTMLFGKFAKLPSDGVPYPIFYFSALLPWTYFAGTLNLSGNSLVNDPNLITKVYFPRAILPASAAISGLVDFCIGWVLLLGMLAYYQIVPTWQSLLWPILVVLLLVFSLGVSLILAALNVKYRDVKYVVPFAIQFLLFATPVIYPMSMIPERYQLFIALNPLSGIIETFRASLIPNREIDWYMLSVSSILTVLVVVVGAIYFRNTERTFADVV